MKRFGIFILWILLVMPATAHAYYFSILDVDPNPDPTLQVVTNTHGDQGDIALSGGSYGGWNFIATGSFQILPDAGQAAGPVDFLLTSSPTTSALFASAPVEYYYNFSILDTSTGLPVVPSVPYAGVFPPTGDFTTEGTVQYFGDILMTGVIYAFMFEAHAYEPDALHVGLDWDISMDVAPTPVPGAIWLLGSGLIGLVGLRGRKLL